MAELKLDGVYKVTVVEFERGWGQRIDPNDTKYFTTLAEAEKYKAHWEEGGTADYFWRAEITRV